MYVDNCMLARAILFTFFVRVCVCLQLEALEIRFTDEEGASEKTFEEVCPGHPFIVFSAKPSIAVVLENPLPRSGLFTINSDVTNGETTKHFVDKIAKIVGLKGA